MPDVRGHIVPGIQSSRIKPIVFNVLLLDLSANQVSTIVTYTEMLHDYLDTLGLKGNRIKLHVALNSPTPFLRALAIDNDDLVIHEVDIESNEAILDLSTEFDVDIILDEIERFTKREVYSMRDQVAIVHWYNPHFNDLLNAICTGWGVAWNFREPVFNGIWVTKYLEPNKLARNVFNFMATGTKQGYNLDQINFIRSMSNKISQINHSKQLLDYTLILQRHANRRGLKTEDLLFEHSYHLNNYYILMSSTLDIFSRLINSVYKLGFGQYSSYTLDKASFLNALDPRRKSLSDIIRLKKHLDWMDWMRQRRNLFAHQTHIGLTPLVQRKKVQLTEQAIDQMVEDAMDWTFIASTGTPADVIQDMKAFSKFQIDLEENHETVVRDIMTIQKQDRITGAVKPVIYLPLRAIDEDYAMFNSLLQRLIDNLTGARKVH